MASNMKSSMSQTRKVAIAFGLAGVYATWGLLYSILPPFYPQEASKKGATPSQYGFVFGIMYLAAFVAAPFFGSKGAQIGPRFLFLCGSFIQSLSGLVFGFLHYVDDGTLFLVLSYILRLLAGLGDAASWGAILGILINRFPDKVGVIASFTDTFFGLGYVLGPALGSLLYAIGGFGLPFYVIGAGGLFFGFWLFLASYNIVNENYSNIVSEEDLGKNLTWTHFFTNPPFFLPFADVVTTLTVIGMLESMLGEHLIATLNPTTFEISLSFLIMGIVYATSMPAIGVICDHFGLATTLSLVTNLLLTACLLLIGPAPFVPVQSSFALTYSVCAGFGLCYGSTVVTSMVRAAKAVKQGGYVDNMNTHLLMTGMYACCFFFGNFLGSTVAGLLVDQIGFLQSVVIFAALTAFMTFLTGMEMFHHRLNGKNEK